MRVGGVGLLDKFNPKEEGFCNGTVNGKSFDYSDVLRKTSHTILGIKDNKCYMVYIDKMSGNEVNNFAKKCDFNKAILMDGGHISSINGSESYAKINLNTIQGYALQGISFNFNNIPTTPTNSQISTSTIPIKPSPKPLLKVALDSGHSKVVSGKRSVDGTLLEYEFNMDISKRIQNHLKRHNVDSIIVQVENTNLKQELNKRIELINAYNPDISVSIHANAHGNGKEWTPANGWEIYHSKGSTNGEKLAEAIHSESIPYLGLTDRGVKETSGLAMVRRPKAPSILIEHGFMTNKSDCENLKSNEYREKFAIADTKGILKYLGIKWIEPKEEQNSTEINKEIKDEYMHKVQLGAFKNEENAQKLQKELETKGYKTIISKVKI